MSNVILFQKEEAIGSGDKQTNENGKKKIRATRARIDVNCAAHGRAVLALEKSKPRQGLRSSCRSEGNLGWELGECERGRIKECLS